MGFSTGIEAPNITSFTVPLLEGYGPEFRPLSCPPYSGRLLEAIRDKRPHILLVGISYGDIIDTYNHAIGVTGHVSVAIHDP